MNAVWKLLKMGGTVNTLLCMLKPDHKFLIITPQYQNYSVLINPFQVFFMRPEVLTFLCTCSSEWRATDHVYYGCFMIMYILMLMTDLFCYKHIVHCPWTSPKYHLMKTYGQSSVGLNATLLRSRVAPVLSWPRCGQCCHATSHQLLFALVAYVHTGLRFNFTAYGYDCCRSVLCGFAKRWYEEPIGDVACLVWRLGVWVPGTWRKWLVRFTLRQLYSKEQSPAPCGYKFVWAPDICNTVIRSSCPTGYTV
jgi:hypothetical protein